MFADNPYIVNWQGLPRQFYAVTDYNQAEQDAPYLIFSCGYTLGNTLPSNWPSFRTYCGLFNTSGDTIRGSDDRNPFIGSLNEQSS